MRSVPSWRPDHASDPDKADEWRFRPLSESEPSIAQRLIAEFSPRFLRAATLPMAREAEVGNTIELTVAEEWQPRDGTRILRLTSWYTGETRWLPDWDGRFESAVSWIRDVADLCGGWVQSERADGGSTPWDEDT
jgi:hypothetical protein